jgi:PAS domain S-box-containing protein
MKHWEDFLMSRLGERLTPLLRDRKQTDKLTWLVDCSNASSMHSAAKSLANTRSHMSAQSSWRTALCTISPYATAVLAVAAAAAVSYPLRAHIYTTPLFFAAVVVSCWYAGTRAGVLATIASTAAIQFLMHLPRQQFTSDIHDLTRLLEFVFVAVVAIYLIAARKRAEQSLRQARDELEIKVAERTAVACASEKKLRDLIETIPAMAFVTRPDGANEFVSRPWIEFSGISSEQSTGASWADSIHADDRAQHMAKWRAACASGEPFENEARHRDADGKYRWLLVRAVPLRDEHDKILKWYGTAIDIEDRKRAEEQLRESEAYLAEAQRLSQTGSWAWSPDTDIRYWSEECYRVLSFDPRDGLPTFNQLFHRIHPDDQPRFAQLTEKVIREKTDFETEHRVIHQDGTIKNVHVVGHPVLNASGDLVEFIGTVIDITERKRAEALLRGEKQLLEMIATGVPLKQILNVLCGIIEEQRPGMLASVLLMNPDGVHLNVIAGPNLPNEWTRQMELIPIGPCAGSCGTAAYRGSPVIVSDIATDPLWDVTEHRAAALKHGLRASWSNPVLSWRGDVLGTFCMYYQEPRAPSSKDLQLIELATHLVRVAIERDRAQEALRASERVARSHVEVMMRSLDVLATEAAPEKFIAEMLRTIGQHLRALRVLLFLRNPQDDAVRMHLVIEDDRQVPVHSDHPFANDPSAWKKRPLLQELLFTKSPVVVDDIETDARVEPEFREYLKRHRCQRFMAVPMFVSGELRGFIGIHHSEKGSYRADEIELAQALAHHVMMAAHGQELVEQQREAAILKERTRMARDIHDTLAQGFTGVIIQMEAAEEALLEEDSEHAAGHVRRARELARDSLGEARRSVHALRPQALEKAAFADALHAIVENTAAGTALQTEFQIIGKPHDLSPAVEENLLHIGQEALTNALKHAHATNFSARISFDSDAVYLELRDNGDGFDVDGINGGGIGLIGMKERADQIGATVKVISEPGKGTKITAVSPYQST